MPAVIKKPKIVKPAVMKAPKIINVGTDFSGIDSSVAALNRMFQYGKFRVIFGSDTNRDAHVMSAHMPGARPEKMYVDVNDRTPAEEKADGALDLYVTAPPCQPKLAGRWHSFNQWQKCLKTKKKLANPSLLTASLWLVIIGMVGPPRGSFWRSVLSSLCDASQNAWSWRM